MVPTRSEALNKCEKKIKLLKFKLKFNIFIEYKYLAIKYLEKL